MSDWLLIGLCLGHATLIFLAYSIATTLDEIRDHIAQRRTPELCDCSCHSGATAGGHTPICWLRRHTTEGMTHV